MTEHKEARIAFCGAHGTGKSTLLAPVAERLGLEELPTPGRWLAQHSIAVNMDATVETQAIGWFLQYQFEHSRRSWISSRSMLDVLAYAAVPAGSRELGDAEACLLEQMTEATRCHLADRPYDLLIYTPPRIPLVADEVRVADTEFQHQTDQYIGLQLRSWGVEHHEIDVTADDAVDQVMRLAAAI